MQHFHEWYRARMGDAAAGLWRSCNGFYRIDGSRGREPLNFD